MCMKQGWCPWEEFRGSGVPRCRHIRIRFLAAEECAFCGPSKLRTNSIMGRVIVIYERWWKSTITFVGRLTSYPTRRHERLEFGPPKWPKWKGDKYLIGSITVSANKNMTRPHPQFRWYRTIQDAGRIGRGGRSTEHFDHVISSVRPSPSA